MYHTYQFNIFPHSPYMFVSRCIFCYISESVIPNEIVEKIARNILTHATLLWLQGQEQCLNTELNLTTLKTVLADQNDQDLLEWLEPYSGLLIHNDQTCVWAHETTVVIKLE